MLVDHKQMIRDIQQDVAFTRHMIGKAALNHRVMSAMEQVERHLFVPEEELSLAYYDGPLSIGYGQTISQPYIVALMTDLLTPEAGHRVLEIGTGSGYQTAVLSRVVQQVYSVEIIEPLSKLAAIRLQQHGYNNVVCQVGDGYKGWPEYAPYDGIIVTAAAPTIPSPLIEQLKPGGKLVIPVGQPHSHQELLVLDKDMQGSVTAHDVLNVAFVPLTRPHGEREL
jgi:protein-L-isoaspartate(D-aspartate) O-methyltransferase